MASCVHLEYWNSNMFNLAIIVPIYNHTCQFKRFLPKLLELETPIILVDDGSSDASELKKLSDENGLRYVANPKNMGKGSAFVLGLKKAKELGYTHIFQIDADGQHSLKYFHLFKKIAQENQSAVINGTPVYHNAPKSRYYGRKITNFWVKLEVPNARIDDAMCGFRIYPVEDTYKILSKLKFYRMGFDIEIIVRLARQNCEIINLPVDVDYPKNGASNFKVFRDNLFISALHTMLCTEGILNYLKKVLFVWKHQ
ncbi:MAG: glycosyltransferase family 2 protein [Verrucomicrobiaceae bacterium]|nr:glycosyltransferase family 2 protein [Verrucomicrobiaceae bacterium]